MSSKWSSLLGLANRARKIVSGEELVVKEVQKKQAKLVLLSKDASANTTKKITDKCSYYRVPLRFIEDRYTLGQAIGKDARVVIAITDDGFAKKLNELVEQ
ncbi:YlxQ family RNA-binding protein [Massilibacterium senegalense]|uniref:YlxQ family RNA-binding protein n=1 Tax=Massilibacterium senegalense TaxID=1632858 RepID=UPI0007816CD8|nr:YlxQ family RNA-binding protein [Massilibacterium senegalense]